ncbi:MAG: hypothetical protein HY907_04245 [Deltaproteobacteria bacterium]|nr:hypothetical protein [Deltaproteobacteria bacterium]
MRPGKARRSVRFALAASAAAAALAGCFGSGGIDPPGHRFFYPTGLALSPGGRYLLVANSNFDLRYNSGTVDVIDLAVVDAEIESCLGRCRGPRDEAQFFAGYDPAAPTLDERNESAGRHTVIIGSQVTDLAIAPDGRRAYAAVRGNASLTWFDLDEDAASGARVLSCFGDPSPGLRRCDGGHEVIRNGDLWLPTEPYALLVDRDWVFTGHVDSGDVAVFDVREGGDPSLVRVLDVFPEGVNGFARQPRLDDPGTPRDESQDPAWYWLVSRYSTRLYPFLMSMESRQAGEGPAVSTGPSIAVDSNDPGTDSRSLAFSPDGTRAFVANREPPSVVVLDTTLREDGSVDGSTLATLDLGGGPSRLVMLPLADGEYVVLVVCFDAEEVFVIDPDLLAVVDVFRTGMGPHAIVPDPARGRAYLGNFGESTVWVLDFTPGGADFARTVLEIGTPEPPTSHE